ncbi:unnamed protein product [Arabidopsis thaliana]|uniref:(thale cress) hypothetical protein n=1 Tax=Arabidopsis thaliana TaxID=3702 RepID=A0A7G2E6E8_ARATH|nr:unnamed protein product [Arabidopsis thaliana]
MVEGYLSSLNRFKLLNPTSAKGKGIERGYSPPPRKRIRGPDLDTSDLIEENALTLIGRLTNPSGQRLWALRGKAIGSDLGQEVFQLKFDFSEDLQQVLDNRPYHFDQRMHYWKPEMLKSIGEELGTVMDQEITSSTVKIKVLLDGLQPITKETIVDFPDGREAVVYLDYKNLKNHCRHCHRLTHEEKHCPGVAKKSETQRNPSPVQSASLHASKSSSRNYYIPQDNFIAPRSSSQRSERSAIPHQAVNSAKRRLNQDGVRSKSPSTLRYSPQRSFFNRENSHRYGDNQRRHHSQDSSKSYHQDGGSAPFPPQQLQWREKSNSSAGLHATSSSGSRACRPPLERDVASSDPLTPPTLKGSDPRSLGMEVSSPPPTKDQVMSELRDVTVQYLSCPDPVENAARKTRVFQGETRNLMETTALGILSAASGSDLLAYESTEIPPGSLATGSNLECVPAAPTKRGRGRPPLPRQANKPAIKLLGTKSHKRNFTQGSPSKTSNSKSGKKTGSLIIPPRPQTIPGSSSSKPQAKNINLSAGGTLGASSSATP